MLPSLASLVVLLAVSVRAETHTLAVYTNRALPGATAVETEVAYLLDETGYDVTVREQAARRADDSFDRLMVVRFTGTCNVTEEPRNVTSGALASTMTEGDRVLPFADVHCDRIYQLVAPLLNTPNPVRRQFLFQRAIARVLAHEVFHYLAQQKSHPLTGTGKACFHARDLMADSFNFDRPTMAKMRAPQPAVTVETEEASAR